MITDPTSAIKREVHDLIDLQIEMLRQESSLTTSHILDFQLRSERIRSLYRQLDRLAQTKVRLEPAKAS
jgi:hypothetical protein